MTSIYYERNKEKMKKWYQEHKEEILRKAEEKRRAMGVVKLGSTFDPVKDKARCLRNSRNSYQRYKDRRATEHRERYATDPEYRKRRLDAATRYSRKKGIKPRVPKTPEEKAQDARDRARKYYHKKNDARVQARRESFGKTEEERKEIKRKKACDYRKAKRDADPERYREENKVWKQKNREYVNAKKRAWMKTPAGIIANRIKDHKRRARLAKLEGKYTLQEWNDLCAKYDNKCLCCGSDGELTADHVMPITMGGTGYISNIQPLCRSCNSRKNAKHIDYRTPL